MYEFYGFFLSQRKKVTVTNQNSEMKLNKNEMKFERKREKEKKKRTLFNLSQTPWRRAPQSKEIE
jgi:hypothetical protein